MQMQDLSESLLFEERPKTPKIEVNDQVMDENEEDERPESPFVRDNNILYKMVFISSSFL